MSERIENRSWKLPVIMLVVGVILGIVGSQVAQWRASRRASVEEEVAKMRFVFAAEELCQVYPRERVCQAWNDEKIFSGEEVLECFVDSRLDAEDGFHNEWCPSPNLLHGDMREAAELVDQYVAKLLREPGIAAAAKEITPEVLSALATGIREIYGLAEKIKRQRRGDLEGESEAELEFPAFDAEAEFQDDWGWLAKHLPPADAVDSATRQRAMGLAIGLYQQAMALVRKHEQAAAEEHGLDCDKAPPAAAKGVIPRRCWDARRAAKAAAK